MLIGITGTFGAGKGTAAECLINKGFKHYSSSGYLTELLKEKGLPINRDEMHEMGNYLRRTFGQGEVVRRLISKWEKDGKPNSVMESLRDAGEVEEIKKQGGLVIAIVAEQKTRYERISSRKGEKDDVRFEEFQQQEQKEMNDPKGMQLSKCIAMADYKIENNKTVQELNEQIEKIIQEQK